MLGLVQRSVGAREQVTDVAHAGRHADRHGQDAALALGMAERGPLDRDPDPLGDLERVGRFETAHDQQQLLSAEAVGAVAGAERAAGDAGDHPQRLIPGQVPEQIVVGLEMVDVA